MLNTPPPTSIMSEWGIYQNELSELSSSSMVVEHTQKRILLTLRNLRLCVTQRASWKSEQDKFPQRVFDATIGNLSIQKRHQISKTEPKLIFRICAGKTITKCKSNPAELCSNYCIANYEMEHRSRTTTIIAAKLRRNEF